jgi:NADH-quinone oxidoreductase subunit J
VDAKAVGMSLYGPYVIGVELSGILLMAGIVGAYHLGRQKKKIVHRFLEESEN